MTQKQCAVKAVKDIYNNRFRDEYIDVLMEVLAESQNQPPAEGEVPAGGPGSLYSDGSIGEVLWLALGEFAKTARRLRREVLFLNECLSKEPEELYVGGSGGVVEAATAPTEEERTQAEG